MALTYAVIVYPTQAMVEDEELLLSHVKSRFALLQIPLSEPVEVLRRWEVVNPQTNVAMPKEEAFAKHGEKVRTWIEYLSVRFEAQALEVVRKKKNGKLTIV